MPIEFVKFVKELYDEVPKSIRYTLTRLIQNSAFKNNVKILREESWLDWQILSATKMLVLTYRNQNVKNLNLNVPEMFQEIKRDFRFFLNDSGNPRKDKK